MKGVEWVRIEVQNRKQNSGRRILRWRAVELVEAARVGEEPERRLCRARVAEEVGEGGRYLGLEGG